jgi:hypothetical protein
MHIQRSNGILTPIAGGRLCCLGVTRMLWTIFAILLILWLLGWGFHIAGGLIHLLLVVAVIVLIINLVTGRRTV